MLGMDSIGCLCRRRSSVAIIVGSVVVPPSVRCNTVVSMYSLAVSVACVKVHHVHAAPDSFNSK